LAKYRQEYGEGSLRKRKDGSWEARYFYVDRETGQRVSKSVYAPTQAKVKEKLEEIKERIENPPDPIDEEKDKMKDITLGDWLDIWMQEYKKNSVRATTYTNYFLAIENHIRPELGNMQLNKVRPDHIQKFLNDMSSGKVRDMPLAPWTVQKAKVVLSGAFEQAIRNQIIPYNPVKATVPPKMDQKEIRVLTEEEQKDFLKAVKGHRLEALYTLTLATGLRRGEVIALTWDNIDFNTSTLTVKGSVSRVLDTDTKKTYLTLSEPKTKSGRRQVPILASLAQVLKEHKQRQEDEIIAAGSAWQDNNIVFASNIGTYTEPRRVNMSMNKITDAAGLPRFTFHSLRHTFATRMLEANISAKIVQDVLGHADVTLTLNTYSHVIGTTAHDHMAKLDGLFIIGNKSDDKPSIQKQFNEATEKVKANEKVTQTKSKGKNVHEL